MKRTRIAMCAAILGLGLVWSAGPVAAQGSADRLLGDWVGPLKVPGASLRIVFHVTADSAGNPVATMDSPDQGAFGLEVSTITLEGDSVTFTLTSPAASYEGRLAADGKSIDGMWKQGPGALPLKLEKSSASVEAPKRPQEPKPPFPYRVEEVSYPNAAAPGVTLAGTLTLPETGGPFPAVVLVSGSGPQNRDEELLGHKPFAVLADYLTRKGIAVLRFDDRGIAKSTGSFATATSQDFASDAIAGVDFLKTKSDIDPARIGIIGHSEGGLIAPIAATKSDDVAFIVLMAGPGLTGEQILYRQSALIARANGASEAEIESSRHAQEQMYAILRNESDTAVARVRLDSIARIQIAALSADQRQAAGLTGPDVEDAYIRAQLAQLNSPWFRYFLTYDPVPTLKRVTVPVLAINGGNDLQVPPDDDLAAIAAALRAGGNKDVTTKKLPGLNHLFQPSETGSPTEYAKIEMTMSPVALNAISDWILERFGNGK